MQTQSYTNIVTNLAQVADRGMHTLVPRHAVMRAFPTDPDCRSTMYNVVPVHIHSTMAAPVPAVAHTHTHTHH